MIQITPHMKILLTVDPIDFRKGIDGLAGLCRKVLRADPFSGYLFVFINRKRRWSGFPDPFVLLQIFLKGDSPAPLNQDMNHTQLFFVKWESATYN